MTLLPVLDILDGRVVRGIAGRRDEYRPLQTPLAATSDPLDVARGIRSVYGFQSLYLADLDGLLHNRPRLDIVRSLTADGFRLFVDNGVRTPEQAHDLLRAGADRVIAALEVSGGPDHLTELVAVLGTDRLTFSLDLLDGLPMTTAAGWKHRSPLFIAQTAAGCGITSLIVLDLHVVGRSGGLSTLPLCREIRGHHPALHLMTGGGVRNNADLEAARRAGIDSLLLSSALHAGHQGRDSLETGAGN